MLFSLALTIPFFLYETNYCIVVVFNTNALFLFISINENYPNSKLLFTVEMKDNSLSSVNLKNESFYELFIVTCEILESMNLI